MDDQNLYRIEHSRGTCPSEYSYIVAPSGLKAVACFLTDVLDDSFITDDLFWFEAVEVGPIQPGLDGWFHRCTQEAPKMVKPRRPDWDH